VEIKVNYVGIIRSILGKIKGEVVEVAEGTTVKQLVEKLAEKYGEAFKNHCIEKEWGRIRNNVFVEVDGEQVLFSPEKYEMALKGKKEVVITTIPDNFLAA